MCSYCSLSGPVCTAKQQLEEQMLCYLHVASRAVRRCSVTPTLSLHANGLDHTG